MSLCWILIDGFSLFLIIWLSFVCCCRRCGPCCGAMLYLPMCCCLCVRECRRVFALLCTCFMVNKQLFSAKVSQLLIRSPVVTPRWQFGRWIPADQPTFVDLGLVSHSDMFQNAGCLLPLTTLAPSEDGPTPTQVFEINPTECSLGPRVL